MEDYNQVPFRDMVSQKIQKKDSERGATSFGFPIHGGKPIKELYRTVYTGGDDKGYMKEPVTKIHRTVTNEEGVSQKTVKSYNPDMDTSYEESYERARDAYVKEHPDAVEETGKHNWLRVKPEHKKAIEEAVEHSEKSDHVTRDQDEADLKNTVRNPQPSHEYGPWGSLESDEETEHEETEHEEKSIRDMVAEKNITGFAKAGTFDETGKQAATKEKGKAEQYREKAKTNNYPESYDEDGYTNTDLADVHDAMANQVERDYGDTTTREGSPQHLNETLYPNPNYPGEANILDRQQIGIANKNPGDEKLEGIRNYAYDIGGYDTPSSVYIEPDYTYDMDEDDRALSREAALSEEQGISDELKQALERNGLTEQDVVDFFNRYGDRIKRTR